VSYKQIPTVTSEKRVQALDTEDTALLASTADYEFYPDVRDERRRMRERARDSTAPNSVFNLQGGNHLEASRETVKMKTPESEVKMAILGDSPGTEEYL